MLASVDRCCCRCGRLPASRHPDSDPMALIVAPIVVRIASLVRISESQLQVGADAVNPRRFRLDAAVAPRDIGASSNIDQSQRIALKPIAHLDLDAIVPGDSRPQPAIPRPAQIALTLRLRGVQLVASTGIPSDARGVAP